jgi:hypothetical protein
MSARHATSAIAAVLAALALAALPGASLAATSVPATRPATAEQPATPCGAVAERIYASEVKSSDA